MNEGGPRGEENGYDQDEEYEPADHYKNAEGEWVSNLMQKANEQDNTMAVDEVGDTGGVRQQDDEEEIQEEIVGFEVQQPNDQ
mmetsp:Transcript_44052/g.42653  ORF Transcript_44052/g.42653 Transcript_44052/m.42653 type:complete len:83 (+) Transcript_44052:1231-1479(+)